MNIKSNLKCYIYNEQSGEIHREFKHSGSDNIPKDYYEKENYHIIRAKTDDSAMKKARILWAKNQGFHEPDFCGHEFPEKSKS